jgi:hypothetical protein
MPLVELLELRKTDNKTLGPVLFDEGTLDGSYEVMESIYKNQFQLDNTEFDKPSVLWNLVIRKPLYSSDLCRPSKWTHLQHTTKKTG